MLYTSENIGNEIDRSDFFEALKQDICGGFYGDAEDEYGQGQYEECKFEFYEDSEICKSIEEFYEYIKLKIERSNLPCSYYENGYIFKGFKLNTDELLQLWGKYSFEKQKAFS